MPHFYKLLADDRRHHGFTYHEGLNVDPLPFEPSGECKPGGLYYTDLEHIPRWYRIEWPLIADVTLPDGARVYAEPDGTKWKADRLVLSNIRPLSEMLATLNEWTLYQMLNQNGEMLRHVLKQTRAVCLAAVESHPQALQFVHDQTDDLCMTAIHQDWSAIQYARRQTEVMCRCAMYLSPEAAVCIRFPMEFHPASCKLVQFYFDVLNEAALDEMFKKTSVRTLIWLQLCLPVTEAEAVALIAKYPYFTYESRDIDGRVVTLSTR
jgi:hypothetical protein